MTRINCIAVSELSNQHLLAEYKEITRPFNKVITRIEKYGVDNALTNINIPDNYVLGSGHESFFFNKLAYLLYRYQDLFYELIERGYNLDTNKFYEIRNHFWKVLPSTPYFNNWKPSFEDKYLNMARLAKRSNVESVLNELKEDN